MNFIINYPKENKGNLGGLGDRINGLISVIMISKLFNKDVLIRWETENIDSLFEYKKFSINHENQRKIKYFLLSKHGLEMKKGKIFENLGKLHKLESANQYFNYQFNLIRSNQNVSKILYGNKKFNFCNYNFKDNFQNVINNFYNDILIPKKLLLDYVNDLIHDKKNIIGIQLRLGDKYLNKKIDDIILLKEFNKNLKLIKLKLEKIYDSNYHIFITSDNKQIYDEVCYVFPKDKVIYDHTEIIHLDDKRIDGEIENELLKLFSDHYILSQKTCMLFGYINSNFCRISMLFSLHDELYSITTLNKISKDLFIDSSHKRGFPSENWIHQRKNPKKNRK